MFVQDDQGFAEQVLEDIRSCFAGQLTVDFPNAARILGIDEKTLRRHTKMGTVGYLNMGHGAQRLRRRFTAADLAAFMVGRRRRELPPPKREHRRRPEPAQEENFLAFTARMEAECRRRRGGTTQSNA